jgi:hypothetical protein
MCAGQIHENSPDNTCFPICAFRCTAGVRDGIFAREMWPTGLAANARRRCQATRTIRRCFDLKNVFSNLVNLHEGTGEIIGMKNFPHGHLES